MGNAVAVMRVSSEKQGFDGDSIEHQKDQIDLYASTRNITIKKYFIFIESASKEQQPVQEAIDYCKNLKNNIDFFIIKSIDRFTRGGSSLYDHMKTELNKHDVKLIDIYGVISNQTVNTLENLGVSYSWSVYNPSKKSELLEAERGHDEVRDILSRMIGSEVRYTRLGYWVRQAPFGYQSVKTETTHGKRYILAPHPKESVFIKRMFELKAQGSMLDHEIIAQINLMGFKTRKMYRRDPRDRNKAIGVINQNPLGLKLFDRLIKNPIFAGIIVQRWTNYKPVKCQFEGLISIETFNKANAGRVMLIIENGELIFLRGKPLKKKLVSTSISLRYPYKRIILCPKCRRMFYGSASRGRLGNHYPSYHCSKRGHYYRVPLKKLHQTVVDYLNEIRIKDEFIDNIQTEFREEQETKTQNTSFQASSIKTRITQINLETELIIEKINVLHTEVALKSLEDKLEKLNKEKIELTEIQKKTDRQLQVNKTTTNKQILAPKKSNKLPEFIINDQDAARKTKLFNRLFEQLPTYEELVEKTAILKPEFEIIE